jgi:hypothetical protein
MVLLFRLTTIETRGGPESSGVAFASRVVWSRSAQRVHCTSIDTLKRTLE